MEETLDGIDGPDKAAVTKGFKMARDDLLKLSYVAGMRSSIRQGIEGRMENDLDLEWVKKTAKVLELAEIEAGKKKAYAAALTATPSQTAGSQGQTAGKSGMPDIAALVRAEIAALGSRSGGGGRSENSGQFQGPVDHQAPNRR